MIKQSNGILTGIVEYETSKPKKKTVSAMNFLKRIARKDTIKF